MNTEEIKNYCLGKWKAYEDSPFGDVPICYRLNKKIFAQIYPNPHDYTHPGIPQYMPSRAGGLRPTRDKITLKCTPDFGQFYRQIYPGVVVRGYYCPPAQQPYWNTIYLKDFPEDELLKMIDHAYDTVLHSFSKKGQKEILTVEELEIRDIRPEEYSLLEDFLYDAIYIPEGMEAPSREVIRQPELAVYIEDFGQPNDWCLVAESGGFLLGTVWCRVLSGEKRGYGNVSEDTPELAISVKKEFRHQGIGKQLMREMLDLLRKKGYSDVSLSVSRENFAFEMYKSLGFQIVKEKETEALMLLELG